MTRVAPQDVDREIETWLGRICLALDLDRSAVYQRAKPEGPAFTSHTWIRPGSRNIIPLPPDYDPHSIFPKSSAWVLQGNIFAYSGLGDVPKSFRTDGFGHRLAPKASASIPMWAGDRVIGAASFGRFRSPRSWSQPLLERLSLAVNLFGAAIERKRFALEAGSLRMELAVAQRRSMMGELVASLTHELNQPLGAIMSNLGGISRLIAESNESAARLLVPINNAIEDTRRAGEIVRRVRALFKGDSNRKVELELDRLVADVAGLIAGEAALRKISVNIEAHRSIPRVVGDRILLQQCVLNLLLNAFDSVVEANRERRMVLVSVTSKGKSVTVSISDSGAGIRESVARQLFEPFTTTKRNGMGLGLLVTRSIIEEHGGNISYRANPDGGAIFTFVLPAGKHFSKGASAGQVGRK